MCSMTKGYLQSQPGNNCDFEVIKGPLNSNLQTTYFNDEKGYILEKDVYEVVVLYTQVHIFSSSL